jgi:hypothetical protein
MQKRKTQICVIFHSCNAKDANLHHLSFTVVMQKRKMQICVIFHSCNAKDANLRHLSFTVVMQKRKIRKFGSSVFHSCYAKMQKTQIWVTGPQCVNIQTNVPSALTISEQPWRKPLNFGFGDLRSLMNFTLIVSIGVTAKMASHTPAPNPHSILLRGLRLPLSSTATFFSCSNEPNLTHKKTC